IAGIVAAAIPEIAKAVDLAVAAIKSGGRMLYVGAGTSGRLALLDSVECPPTFGIPAEWIQAVLAGGAKAFSQSKEESEDDREQAESDLKARKVGAKDLLVGISASGRTPYTLAALEIARTRGAQTAAVVSASNTPMAKVADVVIATPVGPEVIS